MHVLELKGLGDSSDLMVGLVPELTARGVSVSAVQQVHGAYQIDKPGKDSHRHCRAGATEVMVTSAKRWALIHEHHGAPQPAIEELLPQMTAVDLLIVDGIGRGNHPRLEIHRSADANPPSCGDDPRIVAVASEAPLEGLAVPVLDLADVPAIADFIVGYFGLRAA